MHMFHKYVKHACMHEHILEHVYGEKPYMSKRTASKRRFCEWGSEYEDIKKSGKRELYEE